MTKICEFKSEMCLLPTDPDNPKGRDEGFVCGEYQLQYQNDGNLVLYQNQDHRKTIEDARTNHTITKESWAVMDKSGRLMIYDKQGTVPYWQTEAKGPEGCNLYLTDSGDLFYSLSEDGDRIKVDIRNGTLL